MTWPTPHPPRAGFSDVDAEPNPQGYLRMLDLQHADPFKQRLKARCRELLALRPGLRVLDAGAGVGVDAIALAREVIPGGEVVGLDFSQAMVEEATRRTEGLNLPVRFVQGDLHALAFADAAFDRCFVAGTFQHLDDPRTAAAELLRVTRPGGVIVIVDGDHDTRVIDSPYPDVTRRFLAFRNSGMASSDVAHRLYGIFRGFEAEDVTVGAMTAISTDYPAINAVMHFDSGIRFAAEYGAVTRDEADHWIAAVEQAARDGRFFAALTYFITTVHKRA